MSVLPVTHIYKVTRADGVYLGLLKNVTSEFEQVRDVNAIGVAPITINVSQSIDTPREAVKIITTEDGKAITTEDGIALVTEGSEQVFNTTNAQIKNGNKIEIIEVSEHHPNGTTVFTGRIRKWKGKIGTTNDILLTVYPLSVDLKNYLAKSDETLDKSNTTAGQTFQCYGGAGSSARKVVYKYSFNSATLAYFVGNISTVTLKLKAHSATATDVTLHVFNSGTGTDLNAILTATDDVSNAVRSTTVTVSSTTAAEYNFVFDTPLTIDDPNSYCFAITATGSSSQGVDAYLNHSNVDSQGFLFSRRPGTSSDWLIGYDNTGDFGYYGDIFYRFYTVPPYTKYTLTNFDPTDFARTVIRNYGGEGGVVTYTDESIENTGITISSYTFSTMRVSEMLDLLLTMCPSGFYYTVDPGTNVLTFRKQSTTADHVLQLGVDIDDIGFGASTEELINATYVTGGEIAGENIFVYRDDATSIAANGKELDLLVNLGAEDTSTAQALAQNNVDKNKSEYYETEFTIDYSKDMTAYAPGDTIGFSGFGTSIDSIIIPIVSTSRSSYQLTGYLGKLPFRQADFLNQTSDQLKQLQTINNPQEAS